MRLSKRVAIVTGAGRGIGEATAIRLAQEGAKLGLGDIDIEAANKVAKRITSTGRETIAVKVDVANRRQAQRLVDTVVDRFGTVDILINNAGMLRNAPFLEMTEEDWDTAIDVNLKGQMNCAYFALRHMVKQKYGKIVNMSSRLYWGGVNASMYASAKAGIIGLTRSLAMEFGKYNINVNCVAPGPVETRMIAWMPEAVRQKRIRMTPLKRLGQPMDIANAMLFLVSDESTFITGEVIHITGGLLGSTIDEE